MAYRLTGHYATNIDQALVINGKIRVKDLHHGIDHTTLRLQGPWQGKPSLAHHLSPFLSYSHPYMLYIQIQRSI